MSGKGRRISQGGATKMLKWLKQKPVNGDGAMSSSKSGGGRGGADKITDDPLATIQVHPAAASKKSKNKSNEIYAVSRVNPLFEEDDPKGAFSPGNNSGSSGYDSGPTSDDDGSGSSSRQQESPIVGEELEEDIAEEIILSPATLAHVSTHVGNGRNLFRDNDDVVIHHEAALVGADGRPVLQIIQQNPAYVKNIAVAVHGPRRPLSPIAESVHSSNDVVGGAVVGRLQQKNSSSSSKVHAMSVPQRSVDEDATGVGKLIQKNPRYVQSIRIGPSSGLRGQPGYFSSSSASPSTSSAASSPGVKKVLLTRKPSVTFSERVDYVIDERNQRKLSAEHDSIVTDSLLMLTSREDQFEHIRGNWGTSKVLHVGHVEVHNNRRYSGRSNNNSKGSGGGGSYFRNGATSSSENESSEENSSRRSSSDLEAFANSMKKSRPVKQMVSAKLSNEGAAAAAALPHGVPNHVSIHGDTDDDHASDEQSESSTGSQQESSASSSRPRTPRNPPAARSPFGGIADHYAAAKEIAKEIESYSVGTTKSSKRSYVRDLLLSSRGRGGSSSSFSSSDGHIAINIGGGGEGKYQQQQQEMHEERQREQERQQLKESLRVQQQQQQQQVYVKAKSKQQLSTNATSASHEGQDHIQSNSQQVPIYDALPRSTSLSHGLDSANSSDRNSGEVRLEIGDDEGGEPHLVLSPPQLPSRESYRKKKKGTSSSSVTSSSDESSGRESNTSSNASSRGSSNHSKVMLVTGDSQNMVVDLSAVPPDLREAILAGTALITLPDGVKKRLEPGYTMIAIPSSSSNSSASSSSSAASTSSTSSELKDSGSTSDKNSSSSSGGSASGHSSAGEESPLALNKFGTKNKTQIWNVLQHNQISATLTTVGKGDIGGVKSKKFTTILPFHPNGDSNTSPDFTIEGHRLRMQMQKVQHGKQRRCWCRVCGMLFFLVAFLGILVALSLIVTRGERYFGSV